MNLFVVLGLFYLRYTAPEIPRPFKSWIIVPFFFLAAQCFLLIAPFLRPPGGKGDTSLPYWLYPIVGIAVLFSGFVYWLIWRVVLPKVQKFRWVEGKDILTDGTVVTVWSKDKDL
jgi:amino acid transporter